VTGRELATFEFEPMERATVVRIRGEVDLSNAERLHDEVSSRVGETPWLILDLSECGYLDSAGLSAIASIHARCRARGAQLRLVVPTSAATVDRALAITRMDGVLQVDRSLEEALALAEAVG
jgi:anti-sigma B factor antagonist